MNHEDHRPADVIALWKNRANRNTVLRTPGHGIVIALWKNRANRNVQASLYCVFEVIALWKNRANRNRVYEGATLVTVIALWKNRANRNYRASVASGGDPANDALLGKQHAKEQRDRETVQDIGEWYFRECKAGRHRPNIRNPKRESTINNEYMYFDKIIVPAFGRQKLASLTRAGIQSFVDDLADNRSNGAARQSRIILHGIFAFAQRQEVTDKNPVQFVTVTSYKPRERVLTNSELKTIWEALTPPVVITGASISANVVYSVLLAMVTLQRRGEVTGMSLDEIDRERRLWIIPSTRTKNHRTRAVPLSDLALELIDKALAVRSHDSAYMFPSPRDAGKPIKPAAMTRAFGRMKKAPNLGDIRPHDLRRTGATNLTGEHLGFARFTVSKVLNHTSDTGNASSFDSCQRQG